MINKTGKTGSYYNTHYWFKQAYLRWDYKSIPYYEDLIYNIFSDQIVRNQNFQTGLNSNVKQVEFCETGSFNIYQYYTQESYRESKLYIDITINPMSTWTVDITKFETTFDLIKLDNVSLIELPPTFTKEYYLDESYKIPTGTKITVEYYPKGQPLLKNECYFIYKQDIAGYLEYNLHQSIQTHENNIFQVNASHSWQVSNYFMLQMGTTSDDVKIDFLQINVQKTDAGLTFSQTEVTNHLSSQSITKSYNPLLIGLKNDQVASPDYPYLNYAILFIELVSALEQQI